MTCKFGRFSFHKGPVMRKAFPSHDIIRSWIYFQNIYICHMHIAIVFDATNKSRWCWNLFLLKLCISGFSECQNKSRLIITPYKRREVLLFTSLTHVRIMTKMYLCKLCITLRVNMSKEVYKWKLLITSLIQNHLSGAVLAHIHLE